MKTNPVSHDDIARRARALWQSRHCPSGCDDAIWLEAEAELRAALPSGGPGPGIEFHVASPDESAAQIGWRKDTARAPRFQRGRKVDKPEPANTGKPLWQRPHSS